jgi:NAD(P)-dependent dehydrogenase (short-subunit alcohol dehydrogenase family)
LITGAASGIGRSIALSLADGGRTIVCVDVDEAGLDATRASIEARGGTAVVCCADVARREDCRRAVAHAQALGGLGCLVNAAGIMAVSDTVEELDDDTLERMLAVNVMAIFRLAGPAIPLMRAAGGGVIVNVASVHAFATMRSFAGYAASKGAIVALTREMALELATDRVRVVAVAPGAVDTPLTRRDLATRGLDAERAGFTADERAIGRLASPDEVAEVVRWLASDQARLVNGATVVADAGLLARLI